jgi:hypothetical protein
MMREFALQDTMDTQFYLWAGLISYLSGSALQDTIAKEMMRFMMHGRGILGNTTSTQKKPRRAPHP